MYLRSRVREASSNQGAAPAVDSAPVTGKLVPRSPLNDISPETVRELREYAVGLVVSAAPVIAQEIRRISATQERIPLKRPYLTLEEAAEEIDCSVRTLQRYIKDDRLRACGPAGLVRIQRSELDRFMLEERARPGLADNDIDERDAQADRFLSE